MHKHHTIKINLKKNTCISGLFTIQKESRNSVNIPWTRPSTLLLHLFLQENSYNNLHVGSSNSTSAGCHREKIKLQSVSMRLFLKFTETSLIVSVNALQVQLYNLRLYHFLFSPLWCGLSCLHSSTQVCTNILAQGPQGSKKKSNGNSRWMECFSNQIRKTLNKGWINLFYDFFENNLLKFSRIN